MFSSEFWPAASRGMPGSLLSVRWVHWVPAWAGVGPQGCDPPLVEAAEAADGYGFVRERV